MAMREHPWTFGYLNAFFGLGWLNPVYWTSAIEFQFYIAIAFLYPFLRKLSPPLKPFLLITIGCTALLDMSSKAVILHWLPIFCMGITLSEYMNRQINVFYLWATETCLAALCIASIGSPEALASDHSYSHLSFSSKSYAKDSWLFLLGWDHFILPIPYPRASWGKHNKHIRTPSRIPMAALRGHHCCICAKHISRQSVL